MNEAAIAEGAPAPSETESAVEETQQPVEAEASTQEETTPSGEETPKPEAPKKNGVQERISQLTNRAKEAEQRATELQAQIEAMKPETQELAAMPTLEDYEYDTAKFSEAFMKWSQEQTQSQVQSTMAQQIQFQAEQAQRQAQAEAMNVYRARQEAFVLDNPDFHQKVGAVQWQSPSVAKAIATAENGPALAYHLADNQATLQHIQSLPAEMQYMELGRISAQLAVPPPVVTSTAPRPCGSGETNGNNPKRSGQDDSRRISQMER